MKSNYENKVNRNDSDYMHFTLWHISARERSQVMDELREIAKYSKPQWSPQVYSNSAFSIGYSSFRIDSMEEKLPHNIMETVSFTLKKRGYTPSLTLKG